MLAYGVSGGATSPHSVRLDLQSLAWPSRICARRPWTCLPLAAVSGRDFQLLIGRDVLSRLVVEAEFPLGRARFLAPASIGRRATPSCIPLRSRRGSPFAAVEIEAAPPFEVLVDTGCERASGAADQAAARLACSTPGRALTYGHSVSWAG